MKEIIKADYKRLLIEMKELNGTTTRNDDNYEDNDQKRNTIGTDEISR